MSKKTSSKPPIPEDRLAVTADSYKAGDDLDMYDCVALALERAEALTEVTADITLDNEKINRVLSLMALREIEDARTLLRHWFDHRENYRKKATR